MGALRAFVYQMQKSGGVACTVYTHQLTLLESLRESSADADQPARVLDVSFNECVDTSAMNAVMPHLQGELLLTEAVPCGVPLLGTHAGSKRSIVASCKNLSIRSFGSSLTPVQFIQRLAEIDVANPFSLVSISPPWLQEVDLKALPLTRRLTNVFANTRLQSVSDVVALGFDGLSGVKNLGKRSIADFAASLRAYIEDVARFKPEEFVAPIDTSMLFQEAATLFPASALSHEVNLPTSELTRESMRAGVDTSMASLSSRDAEVLRMRLGYGRPRRTLEEIGLILGVSRERARQLESRALKQVRTRSSWPTQLVAALERLLKRITEPLFLDLIAAADPWFDGFQDDLPFFANLIAEFSGGKIHTWTFEERLIAARITEEQWAGVIEASLEALHAQIPTRLSRAEARVMTDAICKGSDASEFVNELWSIIAPSLHFSRGDDGEEQLAGVGRGVRHAVSSILIDSDEPLTFSAIRQSLIDRGYVVPRDAGLRNAIKQAGALLFGRSLYGLRKHLPLTDLELEDLRDDLIAIVLEDPDHQWHSAELVEELEQRRFDLPADFDSYMVNAILSGVDEVAYLGRLVWSAKRRQVQTTRDRHEIAQMMEVALLDAGRPLSRGELREAIERARGLGVSFLPQPSDRVIRLMNGRWGLIDRDAQLTPVEATSALDILESVLAGRGTALHASEVVGALGECVSLQLAQAQELLGRAQIDERFRIAVGGYVALRKWPSLGRVALSEAWERLLADWTGSRTTEEVQKAVSAMTERRIPRSSVGANLSKRGLKFDPELRTWCKPEPGSAISDDDDT